MLFLIKSFFEPKTVFCESTPGGYEILCCDIDLGTLPLRLIGVYRSPSCPSSANQQLVKTVSDLAADNYMCVIAGDFNYPDVLWEQMKSNSPASSEFLEMCASHNFVQRVARSTRGDNILDLVLTNDHSFVSQVDVKAPIGNSDHSVIEFCVKGSLIQPLYRMVKNFSKADYPSILSYLRNVDWLGSLSILSTVNAMYELLISVLKHCIAHFVPWTMEAYA